MRQFISNTVFSPMDKIWIPDKVLAVLFHRSAATLYLIYSLWGITSIFGSLPSIVAAQGDIVQIVFSLMVAPISFAAFVGALYFPKFARLEMYTASALFTLVGLYELVVFWQFTQGNPSYGPQFVLNISHLVIPGSRVLFIYLTLIKQAGDKENVS